MFTIACFTLSAKVFLSGGEGGRAEVEVGKVTLKKQDQKKQDQKMTDQISGGENDGPGK